MCGNMESQVHAHVCAHTQKRNKKVLGSKQAGSQGIQGILPEGLTEWSNKNTKPFSKG